MLKRNLIANYVGQIWTAAMSLLFVPVYIHYLGIEAYGLIGLFAAVAAWLAILDIGMTPTLGREMARYTAGTHTSASIRDLLRTVELLNGFVCLVLAVSFYAAAPWIATGWVQPKNLPTGTVAHAVVIMGVVTAFRFIEGVYRSSLVGLQRQVLFNVISAAMATLRGLGAVAILAWISSTIEAFFVWQACVSFLTVASLASATYASLPRSERRARFSLPALRAIWRFAGGMTAITVLTLLLTQLDKLVLSNLLTLPEFGYYTLAASVAGTLSMLVSPVTQAWYPRLTQLHAASDDTRLARSFHMGAQLITVTVGSAAMILMIFPELLLHLWTQNPELTDRVAPLLRLLAAGTLLNALMWMPYQAQLAHGWTSLAVRTNVVAVCVFAPAILLITPRFGPQGAAVVWIVLNAGYLLVGVHLMFRRILIAEKWKWYWEDILFPMGAAAAVLGTLRFFSHPSSVSEQLALLATSVLCSLAAAGTTAPLIRALLATLFRRVLSRPIFGQQQ